MKRFGITCMLLLLLAALMPGPISVAGHLLGTSAGGMNLYDIDHETGLATNGRGNDPGGFAGIAFSPEMTLYGLTTSEYIYSIEPGDGSATFLSAVTEPFLEGDIDFDPISGMLYAVGFSSNGTDRDLLVTLDPVGGQFINAVGVGVMNGISDPSAMAFDALGNLYVIDAATSILYQIDPTDASVLSSVALSETLGSQMGMDFDPFSGQLFVADGGVNSTDKLYTVDIVTGLLTERGTTRDGGLSGLEFVPEPTTLLFAGIGLLALVSRRRHLR